MNIKLYHRYAPSRTQVAEPCQFLKQTQYKEWGDISSTALEERRRGRERRGEKKKGKRDVLYGTFWEL